MFRLQNVPPNYGYVGLNQCPLSVNAPLHPAESHSPPPLLHRIQAAPAPRRARLGQFIAGHGFLTPFSFEPRRPSPPDPGWVGGVPGLKQSAFFLTADVEAVTFCVLNVSHTPLCPPCLLTLLNPQAPRIVPTERIIYFALRDSLSDCMF